MAITLGDQMEARWVGRFQLPVSRLAVALQAPTGAEDLLLAETSGDDTGMALTLAERLVRTASGGEVNWGGAPVGDLEAFILRLRQVTIGDRICAEVACRAAECAKRIDISFGIEQYLAHHTPAPGYRSRDWRVQSADEAGYFRLHRSNDHSAAMGSGASLRPGHHGGSNNASITIVFRLPTVADQLAVAGRVDAERELARRCLRSGELPLRFLKRVEAAMEALAPSLSGELRGACPECGAEVSAYFDVAQFCLRELRDRAAFIYQDINALARHYHWSEAAILALPRIRRVHYVELARQEEAG